MPVITTREGLKNYCLRKLGAPVVVIDVTEEQIEDRLDDALGFFADFHIDGTELCYLKHKITASTMAFASAVAGVFVRGEVIEGATSGATALLVDKASNNLSARVRGISGTFTNGEVVEGSVSGVTGTLAASSAITLGDVDKEYIELDDSLIGISEIVSMGSSLGTGGDIGMFDIRYQMALGAMMDLTYTDMVQYTMMRSHLALVEFLFSGKTGFAYKRYQNQLKLEIDWNDPNIIDMYILLKGFKIVDPSAYPNIYNDWWLQSYATANIKMQWGQNLKKYSGLQLPGGVTFNGQNIYDEAIREMEQLEEEARKTYQEPVDFFVA